MGPVIHAAAMDWESVQHSAPVKSCALSMGHAACGALSLSIKNDDSPSVHNPVACTLGVLHQK